MHTLIVCSSPQGPRSVFGANAGTHTCDKVTLIVFETDVARKGVTASALMAYLGGRVAMALKTLAAESPRPTQTNSAWKGLGVSVVKDWPTHKPPLLDWTPTHMGDPLPLDPHRLVRADHIPLRSLYRLACADSKRFRLANVAPGHEELRLWTTKNLARAIGRTPIAIPQRQHRLIRHSRSRYCFQRPRNSQLRR